MKRKKTCLIEILDSNTSSSILESASKKTKMPSPKEWLTTLQNAEKTSILQDKIKKVHYKFNDNTEMVEEYNIDTSVVLRRAWKKTGKLGEEKQWEIEIGDPEPQVNTNDEIPLRESSDQPTMMRRNTRVNLEWRIRNLPYPIETYSVAANSEENCIIVRTTNKKFYKKLKIPELERIGMKPTQANIEYSHKFNTLIISYKKPKEMLDLEKAWISELKNVKTKNEDVGDCKPS